LLLLLKLCLYLKWFDCDLCRTQCTCCTIPTGMTCSEYTPTASPTETGPTDDPHTCRRASYAGAHGLYLEYVKHRSVFEVSIRDSAQASPLRILMLCVIVLATSYTYWFAFRRNVFSIHKGTTTHTGTSTQRRIGDLIRKSLPAVFN